MFDIDKFKEIILEVEKTLATPERPFPLASGNCGLLAIAVSTILSNNGIKHSFTIFSRYGLDELDRIPETWEDLIDDKIPCDHMIINVNGTFIDHTCSEECLEIFGNDLLSMFGDFSELHINDMNHEEMLQYVKNNTDSWMDYETIFNHIKI